MNHSGFTLIECLIYLAIFGVFMSGLVVTLGNLNYRLVERERDFTALRDQQFIYDKIEWLLNTADVVTVVNESALELQLESEALQLVSSSEQLFILSTSRVPEPIAPLYMTVEDFIVAEETVGSVRHTTISYTVNDKPVFHYIYVQL